MPLQKKTIGISPVFLIITGMVLFSMGPLQTSIAGAQGIPQTPVSASASSQSLIGTLAVVWYDASIPENTSPRFYLFDETGAAYLLNIPEAIRSGLGGKYFLNNQRVEVSGLSHVQANADDETPAFDVTSINLMASAAEVGATAVTGSKPWLAVLCKFNDVPDEPKPVSYFQNLYGSDFTELNHYWQTVSYGNININGSAVVTHWYTMPSNRAAYFSGSSANLQKLATDCAAAANADVYYPSYYGINLIFNDDLDGYAWGGGWYLSLDGVDRYVPLTWMPPWGYENQSSMAHEMGHAFGLPHSSGPYGATYDSQWDVMSNTWECLVYTVNGCIGTDTISYHKNLLGWIPSGRRYTSVFGTSRLLAIERLGEMPSNPQSYLMAIVDIPGSSSFYTVEVRDNVTNVSNGYLDLDEYEDSIPSNNYSLSSSPNLPVVVIHEVNPNRPSEAQVVDVDQTPNSNPNDEGAMWRPGETFTDSAHNIRISIIQSFGTGYLVRIRNGNAPNNNISNPAVINTIPFTFDEDTTTTDTNATDPVMACGGNIQGEGTVWFQFHPSSAGIVSLDTISSSFDTLLSVWTGSPGSLTNLACDDDSGGSGTSSLTFEANANTTYYIEAAGETEKGDLSFHLDLIPCYTALVKVAPIGTGIATLETAPNCMGTRYLTGSSITYTASPNGGYTFKSWSGSAAGTDIALTIPILSDQTVSANFVATATTSVLLSPANNSVSTDYAPLFKWKTAVLPANTFFDHYQFQLALDGGFTSIVQDQNISDSSTPQYSANPALLANTKYYWRVRVYNTLGNFSLWSPTWILRAALLPPALTSPADAFHSLELRPAFDWEDVPTATGYTIQISRDNTFTQVIHTGNPIGSTYVPTSDLPKNTTLYWRVLAKGANGPSAWSTSYPSFTTPINPPPAPTLLTPASKALIAAQYRPVFTWKITGVLPLNYILQMDDNADFSSPEINNATLTDPTFTATQDLVPNTEYSWRVRAVNGLGEMSNWSAVRYLRAAMLPPTLVSPTEPFASMELRPMFTWNAPPGTGAITGYTIQFSKNNLFTQIVHTGNPAGPSYLPTADLPKNATLYWRVLAKGANGPSTYSTSRALTTPISPPPTPVLMMPGNNALLTSYTNPIFKWKAISMLDASFLYYRVQVADNGAFSSPLIDDTSITNRLTTQLPTSLTLMPDSRYYWRVRAVSTSGELSNWSATWSIRAAILPPTLFMPADDSSAVLRKPLLDWSDVPDNGGYVLQVWKAGPTPVLVKTVTLATNVSQYQFITALLPNTAYYWKLQTKGINGPSLWTDPFDFVTGS